MALKTKDGTFDSKPANYERDTHPTGINFELKDGTALFAPYAYLSHAKLVQEDEIILHYSFGIVTISGQRLRRIFALIQKHELAAVSCNASGSAEVGDPRIESIVFEESADISRL